MFNGVCRIFPPLFCPRQLSLKSPAVFTHDWSSFYSRLEQLSIFHFLNIGKYAGGWRNFPTPVWKEMLEVRKSVTFFKSFRSFLRQKCSPLHIWNKFRQHQPVTFRKVPETIWRSYFFQKEVICQKCSSGFVESSHDNSQILKKKQ